MRGSRLGRFLAAAVLAGAVGEASAAEAIVNVTHEIDHAWLAAEVLVLDVRVANFRGFGRAGRIRVRVTRDPLRIFRGHGLLGRTLDLGHSALGPQKSTADLARCVDSQELVLLVVDTSKSIAMAGTPRDDGYRLRSWCDHADYTMQDAALGQLRGDAKKCDVKSKALQTRFGRARATFWAPVVRFLSGERPAADTTELDGWIRELAAGDDGRRRTARRRIQRYAPLRIPILRKAMKAAEDPELKRQLRELLSALHVYARAYDVSLELTGLPAQTHAAIARVAAPALTGYALTCAEAYAERLTAERESGRATRR